MSRLRLRHRDSEISRARIFLATARESMHSKFYKNLGSWYLALEDFNVPHQIQSGEYSMDGDMDGVAYIGGAFCGRSTATGTMTAGTSMPIRSITRTTGTMVISSFPATLLFLPRRMVREFSIGVLYAIRQPSSQCFQHLRRGCCSEYS